MEKTICNIIQATAFAAILPIGICSAAKPIVDPIAYFSFDDDSVADAAHLGKNTGTIGGTWEIFEGASAVEGVSGGAVKFTTSASSGGAYGENFGLDTITDSFTLAFFAQRSDGRDYRNYIGIGNSAGDGAHFPMQPISNGRARIYQFKNDYGSLGYPVGGGSVPSQTEWTDNPDIGNFTQDTWAHFALVGYAEPDPESGPGAVNVLFDLYYNGEKVNTTGPAGNALAKTFSNGSFDLNLLELGAIFGDEDEFGERARHNDATAIIDELAVYDYALTDSEIMWLASVPEPSSWTLGALGLLTITTRRKRS